MYPSFHLELCLLIVSIVVNTDMLVAVLSITRSIAIVKPRTVGEIRSVKVALVVFVAGCIVVMDVIPFSLGWRQLGCTETSYAYMFYTEKIPSQVKMIINIDKRSHLIKVQHIKKLFLEFGRNHLTGPWSITIQTSIKSSHQCPNTYRVDSKECKCLVSTVDSVYMSCLLPHSLQHSPLNPHTREATLLYMI